MISKAGLAFGRPRFFFTLKTSVFFYIVGAYWEAFECGHAESKLLGVTLGQAVSLCECGVEQEAAQM